MYADILDANFDDVNVVRWLLGRYVQTTDAEFSINEVEPLASNLERIQPTDAKPRCCRLVSIPVGNDVPTSDSAV